MYEHDKRHERRSFEEVVHSPLGRDTPIFRYMPLERFLQMMEGRTNVLSHITHWDDPFEAFVFRSGIMLESEGEQRSIYDSYKFVYGQSWTLRKDESDVLWRAMCPNRDGIRIETTVGDLFESFGSISHENNFRIAKIRYSTSEINRIITKDVLQVKLCSPTEWLDTLFLKRNEFKDENEVRVIVSADREHLDKESDTNGSLLKFKIEPGTLVKSVLADPRMERRLYEQMLCRLYHHDEYSHVNYSHSELYKWPQVVEPLEVQCNARRFWNMLKNSYGGNVPALATNIPDKKAWKISARGNIQHSWYLVFIKDEARIELYLDSRVSEDNKCAFDGLLRLRADVESSPLLGDWRWERLDGKCASRISLVKDGVSFYDENSWHQAIDWFISNLPPFVELFDQKISQINEGETKNEN